MSLSPEVKAAIEKIRQDSDLIASMRKADEIRDKQLADLQAQVDALKAQSHVSDEDRQALADALADARDTHDELAAAVPANTDDKSAGAGSTRSTPTGAGAIDGPSASDGGAQVPLMPNSSFDPAGGAAPPPAAAGQPNQPHAVETAGGFVISGGGAVSRAPDPVDAPADNPAPADASAVQPEPVAVAPATEPPVADLEPASPPDAPAAPVAVSEPAMVPSEGQPAATPDTLGQQMAEAQGADPNAETPAP